MDAGQGAANDHGADAAHEHLPEWGEVLVRSIAHLAAQLTTAQLQLRSLADEAEAGGAVDPTAVQRRLRQMAVLRTGPALRENLGPALSELIDTEALERDLVAYLSAPSPSAPAGDDHD